MAAPKRTKFEKEHDLERTAELYLKRKTQVEIAGIIGVDQSVISRDIALIRQRWRESGLVNTDEAQKEKLAELALLKREHYTAWERSQGERTRTRTEQSTTGKGKEKGGAKAVIEKETMLGNPAHLAGILDAIQEECKILGLYAPDKLEVILKNIDFSKLSETQLARISAGEDVLRVILSEYVAENAHQ